MSEVGEGGPHGDESAPTGGEVDGVALAAFVFSLVSLAVPFVMTVVTVFTARRAEERIATAGVDRRGSQLVTAARVVSLTWAGVVAAAVLTIIVMGSMIEDEDFDGSDMFPSLDRARAPRIVIPDELYLGQVPVERAYQDDIVVVADDVLMFESGDQPGPLRFDEDATLTYTSTAQMIITIVGDGERAVIARCPAECDGSVDVGRYQHGAPYELDVETDGAWYVRVDGGYESNE